MGYGYLAIAALIFGNWQILPTLGVLGLYLGAIHIDGDAPEKLRQSRVAIGQGRNGFTSTL